MDKLIINTTAEMTENKFSRIIFQTNKAKTRYEEKEGKKYLVVPCVMMTEGVHRGSMGSLYYPANELSKTPVTWNHKPVVVYHPQFNGQSVSACDPIVLETYRIGELYNTKWEDGKLKTECWIDEEKANRVDDRVIESVNNGSMMEVSTGLFADNEMTEGEWNGESYISIARNYRPDHLAILPDQIGACSIEDGAGLLRNAENNDTPKGRLAHDLLKIYNQLSHNDIWEALNSKIEGDSYVTEVYDDYFVYEKNNKLFYQKYETDGGDIETVKVIGIPEEVEKIIQYRKFDGSLVNIENVDNSQSFNKEKNMKRKDKVNGMISNEKSPWTEDDREMLMGLTDEKFSVIANEKEEEENSEENPQEKPQEKPAENKEENSQEKPQEKPTENQKENSEEEPATLEEYINNAPEGMRDMLRSGLVAHQENKSKLIQKITANEKNTFTPEQLNAKGMDELKQLSILAENVQKENKPAVPTFFGMGEPATPVANEEEEPLEAPVMNFEEK